MKKVLAIALSAALLSACQAQSIDNEEVKKLRVEVDTINSDLYGKSLGTCEEADIISAMDVYQASLVGIPSPEVTGDDWHTTNGERDGVMTTPSGLQYMVVQEGQKDGATPLPTDTIKVNYHGVFTNGQKFDSSYDRGEPIEFRANGVIQGWIEALGEMKPCEARTLYIPYALAYGEAGRGSIPPKATLMFHVQLLGIERKGLIQKK